ncbi:MAG: DoxX family protein [Acidobacteriota bacterium]
MDFRKVGVWTVTIFIATLMLLTGSSKLVQSATWQQQFADDWGLPAWLATVTGLAEMAGALLLLMPRRAVYGGAIIALVMIGATGTHVAAGELERLPITVTIGTLAAFVAWYRRPRGPAD